MSEKRNREKIDCFEEWMKGDHVMVHVDSRREGVLVPQFHSMNPSLTLQLSYAFRGETTHDDREVRSYLKFQGEYFQCVLPWGAIWGLTAASGDGRIWPQDMPKELIVKMAQSKLQAVGKKLFGLEPKKTADVKQQSQKPAVKQAGRRAEPQLRPVVSDKQAATRRSGGAEQAAKGEAPATEASQAPDKNPPSTKRSPSLKRVK